MEQILASTIPDFTKVNILVVGDIMLDRYWFGETSRVSPEAPVPIVKINNKDEKPGGAGNVALNIAALGAKVTLMGLVGEDEAAAILLNQLDLAKVQHDIQKSTDFSTIVKHRIISRHQQLLRMDFETAICFKSKENFIAQFEKHLDKTDLVILSDYNKGTLFDPQVFIQLAKAKNVPVLVDPKNTDYHVYQHASIITPNFKEFEEMVGVANNEQVILEKGRGLLEKYQIDALLITRGADGMTMMTKDEVYHLPAFAREVFDVTGAGDTVIAVLGASYAASLTLLQSMSIANLAASVCVGKLGAGTVTPNELKAVLSNKTNHIHGMMKEADLLVAVKEAKAQKKKIVFTNGCFDILHAGHVAYLQMAKSLGDILIVAVNTDESIKKLKGDSRPINHLEHRMLVLASLGAVDWVVAFNDETPERLLKLIKPDLLVKGGDYQLNQVVGADIVYAYGGEVRVMNHNIKTTSSSLIHQLTELA